VFKNTNTELSLTLNRIRDISKSTSAGILSPEHTTSFRLGKPRKFFTVIPEIRMITENNDRFMTI
jgi:hypothetical protein